MGDFDTTSRSVAVTTVASSVLPFLAHELVKHRIPEYETVLYIPRKFRAQGINSRLLFEGVFCPGARKCDTLYGEQCLMFSVKVSDMISIISRYAKSKKCKKKSIFTQCLQYICIYSMLTIYLFCIMRYFSHFVGFSFISEVLNNLTRIFYFYSFKILNWFKL